MTYAKIKNNRVSDIFVLDDEALLELFTAGTQVCLRIDTLIPIPGIGWTYDGTNFIKPPPRKAPNHG